MEDTQKGKTRFVVLRGKMPPIVHLNTVSHSVILSLSNIYIYICAKFVCIWSGYYNISNSTSIQLVKFKFSMKFSTFIVALNQPCQLRTGQIHQHQNLS